MTAQDDKGSSQNNGGAGGAGAQGGTGQAGGAGQGGSGGGTAGAGAAGSGVGGGPAGGAGAAGAGAGGSSPNCPGAAPPSGSKCPAKLVGQICKYGDSSMCGSSVEFCECLGDDTWSCSVAKGPPCQDCGDGLKCAPGNGCGYAEGDCKVSCQCGPDGVYSCAKDCPAGQCTQGAKCQPGQGCGGTDPNGCPTQCFCNNSGAYQCESSCPPACPVESALCGSACAQPGLLCTCFGSNGPEFCTCDVSEFSPSWKCGTTPGSCQQGAKCNGAPCSVSTPDSCTISCQCNFNGTYDCSTSCQNSCSPGASCPPGTFCSVPQGNTGCTLDCSCGLGGVYQCGTSCSGDTYCGVKEADLPSISGCDDANASPCALAMCAATGPAAPKDCKKVLADCHDDASCNKAVSCGSVCQANDPSADVVATCTPLAGTAIGKALAYKGCADHLTACGGDGTYDKK